MTEMEEVEGREGRKESREEGRNEKHNDKPPSLPLPSERRAKNKYNKINKCPSLLLHLYRGVCKYLSVYRHEHTHTHVIVCDIAWLQVMGVPAAPPAVMRTVIVCVYEDGLNTPTVQPLPSCLGLQHTHTHTHAHTHTHTRTHANTRTHTQTQTHTHTHTKT